MVGGVVGEMDRCLVDDGCGGGVGVDDEPVGSSC